MENKRKLLLNAVHIFVLAGALITGILLLNMAYAGKSSADYYASLKTDEDEALLSGAHSYSDENNDENSGNENPIEEIEPQEPVFVPTKMQDTCMRHSRLCFEKNKVSLPSMVSVKQSVC